MSNKRQFEQQYSVIIEVPVHWGEMDAFHHVNNTVYFRYFESARIEYMNRIDMLKEMQATKIGPILASTDCRFRRPVTYPDQLLVGARITELQSHGYLQEYAVFSLTQDTITTIGHSRIVMVDYHSQSKVPLSNSFIERITQLEGCSEQELTKQPT